MQNFEEALNDQRIQLHGEVGKGSELSRMTRGKFKYLFLKAADRRTEEEKKHINEVVKDNEFFFKLELIKERMLTFFNQPDENEAKKVLEEVGDWIWQGEGFLATDDTDEDVFSFPYENSAVMSVRVGFKKKSNASYFLERQSEINRLLKLLITYHQDLK